MQVHFSGVEKVKVKRKVAQDVKDAKRMLSNKVVDQKVHWEICKNLLDDYVFTAPLLRPYATLDPEHTNELFPLRFKFIEVEDTLLLSRFKRVCFLKLPLKLILNNNFNLIFVRSQKLLLIPFSEKRFSL